MISDVRVGSVAGMGVALVVLAGCSTGSEGAGSNGAEYRPIGSSAETATSESFDEVSVSDSVGGLELVLTVGGGHDGLEAVVEVHNPGSEAALVVGPCRAWSVDFELEALATGAPDALERSYWAAVERAVDAAVHSDRASAGVPRACPGLDVLGVEAGQRHRLTGIWSSPAGGEMVEADLRFQVGVDDGSEVIDDLMLEFDRLPQVDLVVPVAVPEPDLVTRAPVALELMRSDPRVVEWFDRGPEDPGSRSSIATEGPVWTLLTSAFGRHLEVVVDVEAGVVVSVDELPNWEAVHKP